MSKTTAFLVIILAVFIVLLGILLAMSAHAQEMVYTSQPVMPDQYLQNILAIEDDEADTVVIPVQVITLPEDVQ